MRSVTFREEQWARRFDPHVEPLNRLVDDLIAERNGSWMPYIPAYHGGTEAKLLLLYQDPGKMTSGENGGSGFLGCENDDPSAQVVAECLDAAGIDQRDVISWNAYPWFRPGQDERLTGSMIEQMDAAHPAQVLAITSHLPHLIAYTIVGTATDLEDDLQNEGIKFSAAGFRDFTRIAASDPVMWRDVFLQNKQAVLDVLARFTEDLTAMQRAIRRGEGETLEKSFTRTRAIRRGIVEAHQAGTFKPAEPDEDKD